MFTTLIAILFTLVLVAGVPALSYSTARNREIWKIPRLNLYASAVFSQWILTSASPWLSFLLPTTRGLSALVFIGYLAQELHPTCGLPMAEECLVVS